MISRESDPGRQIILPTPGKHLDWQEYINSFYSESNTGVMVRTSSWLKASYLPLLHPQHVEYYKQTMDEQLVEGVFSRVVRVLGEKALATSVAMVIDNPQFTNDTGQKVEINRGQPIALPTTWMSTNPLFFTADSMFARHLEAMPDYRDEHTLDIGL